MLLLDTSAWIEYLRATGSETNTRVRIALEHDHEPLGTTDVVVMELLAGARGHRHRDALRRLLYGRCEFVGVRGPLDFEQGAELYRTCRARGETIRKLNDCLIAAVAIRSDATLLHRDADYDAIARHTALRVAPG